MKEHLWRHPLLLNYWLCEDATDQTSLPANQVSLSPSNGNRDKKKRFFFPAVEMTENAPLAVLLFISSSSPVLVLPSSSSSSSFCLYHVPVVAPSFSAISSSLSSSSSKITARVWGHVACCYLSLKMSTVPSLSFSLFLCNIHVFYFIPPPPSALGSLRLALTW